MNTPAIKSRHLFDQPARDLGLDLHYGRDRLTVTNPETGNSMWWFYSHFNEASVLARVVENALIHSPEWTRDAQGTITFNERGPSSVAHVNSIIDRMNAERRHPSV